VGEEHFDKIILVKLDCKVQGRGRFVVSGATPFPFGTTGVGAVFEEKVQEVLGIFVTDS